MENVGKQILKGLNEQQEAAILKSLNKDTCLIAGAGAGKSTVIVKRIQYLLAVKEVPASSIMCITFTRKAANELLEKVKKVSEDYSDMWVGTFHSICIKLLRLFSEDIGIKDEFTILPPYYANKTAKEIVTRLGGTPDKKTIEIYLKKMSRLKNSLISPRKYREKALLKYSGDNEALKQDLEYEFIEFYSKFQRENLTRNLLDFDDIIYYAIQLLLHSKNCVEFVNKRFKYISCDEAQDSNDANMVLLNLLSKISNLFIVCDVDQSIYSFRGARPELVMNFQTIRPGSQVLKLERNYRSTKNIVEASNFLIEHNIKRPDKVCFSKGLVGGKIFYDNYYSNREEARAIAARAKSVVDLSNGDVKYGDIMVLYRTNIQSHALQDEFLRNSIPHNTIGSVNFIDRAEIKDCMSFLRIFINKEDKESFRRLLESLSGIGQKSIDEIMELMDIHKDVINTLKTFVPKNKKVLESIQFIVNSLALLYTNPTDVLRVIAKRYTDGYLEKGDEMSLKRIDNINEFLEIAKEKEQSGAKIREFVEQMDLMSSNDKEGEIDKVNLMTIHASKGLEAKIVFLVGVNEDILPHKMNFSPDGIEDERRLMYVGMTRAKEKLYISSHKTNGRDRFSPSRFLVEIPSKYMLKCN